MNVWEGAAKITLVFPDVYERMISGMAEKQGESRTSIIRQSIRHEYERMFGKDSIPEEKDKEV